MHIELSPQQASEIDKLVIAGRFGSAKEAIRESVNLLLLREQITIGVEQADRGEVTDHDTLFAELKARAENFQ